MIYFKFRADLLCQKQSYNIPLSNNVMPAVKNNKFKNMCIFMDPHEQKQGTIIQTKRNTKINYDSLINIS